MNILVSGAHGLVGGALRAALLHDGDRVVTLTRSRPEAAEADQVAWDPGAGTVDHQRLRTLGPYDGVVHLTGAGLGDGRWTPARRTEIVDSRVRSTRTLVAALARLDPVPTVLVSASAVGYYGDRGDEELTEESTPGSGFLAELCRAWEDEAAQAAEHLRVVRLRSGIVLSTRGGALARQLPLFRAGLGARLGDGHQYVSWISLDDEVGVLRRAIGDPALEGPVNAVAPAPVTNAAFTAALGRALHRPAVLRTPRSALSLAFGRQMTSEMLLASQRVLPAALTAVGHQFSDPDLDGALARLLAAHG